MLFFLKEIFCALNDKIVLHNEHIDIRCNSCNRYNHSVINCPLIHYEIDQETHIKRLNYINYQKLQFKNRIMHSIPQERNSH